MPIITSNHPTSATVSEDVALRTTVDAKQQAANSSINRPGNAATPKNYPNSPAKIFNRRS